VYEAEICPPSDVVGGWLEPPKIDGNPTRFGPLGQTYCHFTNDDVGHYGYWVYLFGYIPGEPVLGFFGPW
jgi:hypothetical protein